MTQFERNIYSVHLHTLGLELGEGLHWDKNRGLVWCVDILNKKLLSIDISNGQIKNFKFDDLISWVITRDKSMSLMIGMKDRICSYMPEKNKLETIVKVETNNPNIRLNDAKIDSKGNIWFGTMNYIDPKKKEGKFFCLKEKTLSLIDDGYNITNGPAINKRKNYLLHNDSYKRIIYKYENIGDTENIKKTIWKKFGATYGSPDGMCFDRDENLWLAHWGAGIVTKTNIHGKELLKIPIPTPYVTNICFVGERLDRLIVSTARNESNLPLAGDLFEIIGHGTAGIDCE